MAKKDRKKKGVGCCGFFFAALAGFVVCFTFYTAGKLEKVELSDAPSLESKSEAGETLSLEDGEREAGVEPVKEKVPVKKWKIHYPLRAWRDLNGKKMEARLVKIASEEVVLKVGRKRRTFDRIFFCEEDQCYLEALQNLDLSGYDLDSERFELRVWTPWRFDPFEARLLDADERVIFLFRDGKLEVYSRRDFSVPDLDYFKEIGFESKIN